MKPTQYLHDAGQSLWLDNITRGILNDGTLATYVRDYSITGLTSNPSIFDKAIEGSDAYDDQIRSSARGISGEELFYELAIADLQRAADLFNQVHGRTSGVDGWASLELSPLLAYNTEGAIESAKALHARSGRDNIFIKIPGNEEGAPAIEESIYAGVPINVTLLFSWEQYLRAAEAFMRGIERRVEAGLDPDVASVASVFVSRWDRAIADDVPAELRNRLGITEAMLAYRAYRELLDSPRWQRLENEGARTQRLLWASTSTKDPDVPNTLYVEALAAPLTINTVPDATLVSFAEHGKVGRLMAPDGGDAEHLARAFADAGFDRVALAHQLQREGAEAFDASWRNLLGCIETKAQTLAAAG